MVEEHALGGRLRIKFIRGLGYKGNISIGRLRDHRKVAAGFRRMAGALVHDHIPDAVIASLPPHDIAYEAVRFANTHRIPVAVDVRDPWPDLFADHAPAVLSPLVKPALAQDYRMSHITIRGADALMTVSDDLMRWARETGARKADSRDTILPLGYLKNPPPPTELVERIGAGLREKFVVFFVGTISAGYHDPSILIDAAKALSHRQDIHFVIAGDGTLLPELKQKAGGFSNVTFPGWIDYAYTGVYLCLAGAGVCPATREVSLPTNKAYAYLSAGLPILTSFSGELRDELESYGAGWYCQPGDLRALTRAIEKLADEPDTRAAMSSGAVRLFDDRYDARAIYARYADDIEGLATRR
jgi:glycosyltransferase involved in cell wall biosynthesis